MKKSTLEEAVEWVLGPELNAALRDSPAVDGSRLMLPERLKFAALEAFRRALPYNDIHIERLREGLRMLQKEGMFTFDREDPE